MNRIILLAVFLFAGSPAFSQDFEINVKKEFPYSDHNYIETEFSAFRNYFAVTMSDNSLEIYDRNWDLLFNYKGNTELFGGSISFSPDERFLAYSGYLGNNRVAIIRLTDMKVINTFRIGGSWINDLEFSHSGDYLVSASEDKKMAIWKREANEFRILKIFDQFENSVKDVTFSRDDKYLLSVDNAGFITVFEKEKGNYNITQQIKNGRGYIYAVNFHPEKEEFVTGTGNGLRRYINSKDGFIRKDSIMEMNIDSKISFSPTGNILVVPSNSTFHFLGIENKKIGSIDALHRFRGESYDASFSPDGKFLATIGADVKADNFYTYKLIIWEITPVDPSKKTIVASWVNDNLTLAQRKILDYEVVSELVTRVDKDLANPRDEFETTEEFNARRKVLEDWTMALIQRKMEDSYGIISEDDGTVSIPLQSIIGYNADKNIYKISFLETEAGVIIPVNEARDFKEKWKNAKVIVNKERTGNNFSYKYSHFRLKVPGISRYFEVSPLENPFNLSDEGVDRVGSSEAPVPIPEAETSGDEITNAVLFATNIYDSFSDLVNPILDAGTIAAELEENFGVNTELVINPTLTQTAEKIREYASRNFSKNESLLIFFAGHGVYDEVFREGYVISSDSKSDDISKTSYLSHSNLRTMVNNINCEHILLVMDVCFGGTFDPHLATSSHRGVMEMYADIPREEFIERKMKYKTRLYLTSGGKEYVPDGRQGFHSPFARRFIEALRMYGGDDGVLTTSEILSLVEKVDPQPRFGEFGDNEPGSDFILISK